MDNLYILKTYGANGSVLYKFGYSSNMDKRMEDYKHLNPFIELVGTYYNEGGIEFERLVHSHIQADFGNEWYSVDKLETILDYIHNGVPENVSVYNLSSYKDVVTYFRNNNIDGKIEWNEYLYKSDWIQIIETSYRLYKRTWMDISYAKKMIENYSENSNLLNNEICNLFVTGKSYTRKEVKEKLQELYDANNLKRKAKHTDLDEVMTVRHKKVKGERFIEILGK